MRISSLTLENFRCFRGTTTIDLAADVVAIYGRNGVGKTALFDAIEFGLLGKIGRFEREWEPLVFLPNAMEDKLPRVNIELANGRAEHVEVSLSPDGENELSGSGGWATHRDLLYDWLVSERYKPARREVAPLRDLFRTGVLLSQSSIRDYIDADPAGRAKVLTNIAGAPYLYRCLEKAKDVQALAFRRIEQVVADSDALSETLRTLEQDVAVTEQQQQVLVERLVSGLTSLAMLLQAAEAAGIPIEQTGLGDPNSQQVAAVVAAACREMRADLQSRASRLAELESMVLGHEDRLRRRGELESHLEQFHTELQALDRREQDLRGSIDAGRLNMRQLEEPLARITRRILTLDEVPQLQRRLAEHQEAFETSVRAQEQLQADLESVRQTYRTLSEETTRGGADRERALESMNRITDSLAKLEHVKSSLPAFEEKIKAISNCDLELANLVEETGALGEGIAELREKRRIAKEGLAALEERQHSVKSELERKNSLLASLREYASDRQCPLCGHPHDSQEKLSEAIEWQLSGVPQVVRELAERTEAYLADLARLDAEIQGKQDKMAQFQLEGQALSETRQQSLAGVSDLRRDAANLKIEMDLASIESAISDRQFELTIAQERYDALISNSDEALAKESGLALRVHQVENAAVAQARTIGSQRGAIRDIQERILGLGLSEALTWTADRIVQERNEAKDELSRLQAQKAQQEGALNALERGLMSARDRRASVDDDMRDCENKLAGNIKAIEEVLARCSHLGLPGATPETTAKTARSELNRRIEKINAAERVAEEYEWSSRIGALRERAAATKAQCEEIREQIGQRFLEHRQLAAANTQVEQWSQTLKDEVTDVVERRIRAHQPEIVRLFRAMIPFPYLIQDILMRRSDDGIELGLRYRDQVRAPAEPKLFLSSAQANILALAIFLSLSCMERWSRLETILLDDPVQHLDDLDAVAFLDNLRAAALGRYGQRKQIIVSTCDQNLYLLILRKFHLTRSEGLTFRGISLLENGVHAPEVVYDVGGPRSDSDLSIAV